MNVELVAQMFKNYQSNVLFHLEGMKTMPFLLFYRITDTSHSYRESERALLGLTCNEEMRYHDEF